MGPGFSFFARIRYNEFSRDSKIFDFGNGSDSDNVYIGNEGITNTLVFATYQGDKGVTLSVQDFWPLGETHEYLFAVAPAGMMKVFCDGVLVGSKKGYALRSLERSQLYVGRSNWPLDAPFEGSIAHIKVWNQDVEWSGAEKSFRTSQAESWALEHSPRPAISADCTYPCGVTINFSDFASIMAPAILANAPQRTRILEEISSGRHMRIAVWIYQTHGWDLQGSLTWQSGTALDFVCAVFEELNAMPPDERQLHPLYTKFCTGDQLAALECLCFADAALRAVFFSDKVIDPEPEPASAQPEASGQPQKTSSPGRRSPSIESINVQPGATSNVRSGSFDDPYSGGRTSSRVYGGSSGYGSTGVPVTRSVSARSPWSPSSSPGVPVSYSISSSVPRPLVTDSATTALMPGERVEALFGNGGWYPATVEAARPDGLIKIAWDDGADYECQKSREQIRRLRSKSMELRSGEVINGGVQQAINGGFQHAIRRDASSPIPMAVAAIDTNHDGRPNFHYVGVDWNRDGIPDALQKSRAASPPPVVSRFGSCPAITASPTLMTREWPPLWAVTPQFAVNAK